MGYDWSQGAAGYNRAGLSGIFLHAVTQDEIKLKPSSTKH
jgi:hypothetical protein